MFAASYKQTIILLKIITFLKEFSLITPIMLLLYKSKGISTGDFYLIQGVFCWVVILLEIPTGYIGDIFSRKKVLIISAFIHFLGIAYLIIAQGFWQILVFETLAGVSACLLSGTIDAYLYDVLEKLKKEKENLKYQGELNSMYGVSMALAGIGGGILYAYDTLLPVYIECIFLLLAVIFNLFLPDIKESRRIVQKGTSKIKDILSLVRYSLKGHDAIKWIIWSEAFLFAGGFIIYWSVPGILEANKLNPIWFGLSSFAMFAIESLLSKYVHKISDKFGIKKVGLVLLPFLIFSFFSCIFLLKEGYFILIPLLLLLISQGFAFGIGRPLFTSIINTHVKSNERATIISVAAMVYRLVSSIIFIGMKPLTDSIGISVTMLLVGIFLLLGLIPLYQLHRKKII